MKKIILTAALLTAIVLSAAAGYSYPCITHMFYDNETGGLYVFSEKNEEKAVTDAGVYSNGEKYSIIKDENDEGKLEKVNAKGKFGIGLISPEPYFENLLISPYISFSDDREIIGDSKSYDISGNKLMEERVLFFENFTGYSADEIPGTMRFTANKGTSVQLVKEKDEYGNDKNMLLMDDSSTGSAVAKLTVPEYAKNVMLEMKFKFVKKEETPGFGFIMDFTGNGNRAFRLIKYADTANDGLTYVASSSCNVSGKGTPFDGEWFTLKVRIDSQRNINQVVLENNQYTVTDANTSGNPYSWQNKKLGTLLTYNLLFYNEFEEPYIDLITFTTYGKSYGQYFIDYIKLVEDVDEFRVLRERAPSKYIERIPDPVPNW